MVLFPFLLKLVGDPVFVNMGKKYEKTSAHVLYRWAIEHDIGTYIIILSGQCHYVYLSVHTLSE